MKVKRRLQAFFVQEEGEEARVAFVAGGKLIHYYLPIKLLHDAGVRVENQPFELDELEATVAGVPMTGYKVRASAPAQDARTAPLGLDQDRQQKLAYILGRKWDAGR
ncbi:MAG: hypothetical protein HY735_27705 [Verrucomicrobia bacterium]|nr:hypothetical protein [Verrucomicrobiota bacterium]